MTSRTVELALTGERTLPGIPLENYWFMRHLAAYELALGTARGKKVIDVGCGEGYGPALLASSAAEVLGVDVAPEVVEHAAGAYPRANLSFRVMDVGRLDVPSGSFDVALSFQVIEHLANEAGYLEEIARVLREGGTALITTPNRLTISPGSDRPVNPFHLREYTPPEFEALLRRHFDPVAVSGLFHAGWLRFNDRLRLVDFIKVYRMSRSNPRFWTHRLLTPLVKTRDFRFSRSGVEQCLDIVAVCVKSLGKLSSP